MRCVFVLILVWLYMLYGKLKRNALAIIIPSWYQMLGKIRVNVIYPCITHYPAILSISLLLLLFHLELLIENKLLKYT